MLGEDEVPQIVGALWREHCHVLGCIHYGTATERDHKVAVVVTGKLCAFLDGLLQWVRRNLVEDSILNAGLIELGFGGS